MTRGKKLEQSHKSLNMYIGLITPIRRGDGHGDGRIR